MGILDWFRGEQDVTGRTGDARTDEALERIVELTNPRLRFARRYRARLKPAVRTAMEYAKSVVARAAPAREASAAAWQSDATIRALFATAEDLARAFSRSPDLREWCDRNTSAQDVYAVLSMLLVERRTLGLALEGGVLRRDVQQTTVSFDDCRVRVCGRSELELRQEIERRVLDQLALTGLALAAQEQSRRAGLEQEIALLRARLRLLERRGAGLTALAGKAAPENSQLARVQTELAMNEANLKSLAAGHEGLELELERLREVLSNPSDHFYLSTRRLRLDRMNVVLREDSAMPGETLDLQVAHIPVPAGPAEFRTVMLVRFPRSALLPKGALWSDAARTLH